MSTKPQTYQPGKWKALCDVCGFLFLSDKLKQRWDGAMVCEKDYETRQPQDLIKGPRGDKPLPWSRPEPPDQFITVTYVASTVGVQDDTIPSGTFNSNTL